MTRDERELERVCAELMNDLYTTAAYKCRDCEDIDTLVQESMLVFLVKRERGETIDHPRAFLERVLVNKYNDMLRAKSRSRVVSYEQMDDFGEEEPENTASLEEEYTAVRRLLGRLSKIYREVAVRHYVRGESVDSIAAALDIPRGTVLSRLAAARGQIKEGMEQMEKYSEYSYAPKRVSIGIWGSAGLGYEPFSLIPTPLEQNLLILAYENPVSIRGLADTMGMPSAYIEPVVEKLIAGELLGRTPGGLVYTRCYMVKYEDSFGDIPAQEALAGKYAARVWEITWRHLAPFMEREIVNAMNEKQKATLILHLLRGALSDCVMESRPMGEGETRELPERPNGGRWFAAATIFENGQERNSKYDASGPVLSTYRSEDGVHNLCQMFDFQSCFGDAHWAYKRMRYQVNGWSVMRFLASFLDSEVTPDNKMLYDLIPDFEELHILRRNAEGEIELDIPALPYEEVAVLGPISCAMTKELRELLGEPLGRLRRAHKNHVPKHVDNAGYYRNANTLGAYLVAQLLAVAEGGFMPYSVEIGATPLIYIAYRRKEGSAP